MLSSASMEVKNKLPSWAYKLKHDKKKMIKKSG
jgi:hypothetical protein